MLAAEVSLSDTVVEHQPLPFYHIKKTIELQLLLGTFSFDPDPSHGNRVNTTSRNFLATYYMIEARMARGGKKWTNLEAFVDLPTDLILETFTFLRPIDLFHVSLANKTVFRQNPELPGPPPDISHAKWAGLLFGPLECDICGKRGCTLDYVLAQRYCRICWEMLFVHRYARPGDTQLFPPDGLIWSLIPESRHLRGSTGVLRYTSTRYSIRDILETTSKIVELDERINRGDSGAEIDKQVYITERSTRVKEITSGAGYYEGWFETVFNRLWNTHAEVYSSENKKLRNWLVKRGYESNDISEALNQISMVLHNFRYISRSHRAFKRRCAVRSVEEIKTRRLEREKHTIAETHRRRLAGKYESYRGSIPSCAWKFIPPFPTLIYDSPYQSLSPKPPSLDSACTAELEKDFDLLSRVAQWQEQFLNKLITQIPMSTPFRLDYNGQVMIARNFIPSEAQTLPVSLATHVFVCGRCKKSLHGFNAISEHLHCIAPHDKMLYSSSGATIAEMLIKLVHMDPTTASVCKMDDLDARFMCTNCPIRATDRRGARGRYALSWKECVAHHLVLGGDNNHLEISFVALSPEFTRRLKMLENRGGRHSFKETVGIALHPQPIDLHCLRCPAASTRLFAERSITPHMADKHRIRTPVLGVDYEHLPLWDVRPPQMPQQPMRKRQ